MTHHKGESRKQAVDADDLAEIVDCFRRIQKIGASLNYLSPQQHPLYAAAATIKACWSELSGSNSIGTWTYPSSAVPTDGLSPIRNEEAHITRPPPS